MTKPSEVRSNLSKYICSVLWVQEWGIQDPLKPSPAIANKTYPPNVAGELPIEQLEILPTQSSSGSLPNRLTCRAKFPFRITYIFKRDVYQDFRSIPIAQIENLLFRVSQLLLLFANRIDEDIVRVEIPQQGNPFILRAADDVASDRAFADAWAVTAKLDIDVEFISSPDEFLPSDYADIQPAIFSHPNGDLLPDIEYNPFDLNQIRIEVNRSHLPAVNPAIASTFELEEIIILEE